MAMVLQTIVSHIISTIEIGITVPILLEEKFCCPPFRFHVSCVFFVRCQVSGGVLPHQDKGSSQRSASANDESKSFSCLSWQFWYMRRRARFWYILIYTNFVLFSCLSLRIFKNNLTADNRVQQFQASLSSKLLGVDFSLKREIVRWIFKREKNICWNGEGFRILNRSHTQKQLHQWFLAHKLFQLVIQHLID